ncbi:MAG TPA: ankyrin repeat domain-containing protein [Rhodanobacteraceae bacterium]
MSSTKFRQPSLVSSLIWYVPVVALIVVAIFLLHPLVLIPLLVACALAMATVCHAIGFGPEPSIARTIMRRGAAWLVLFTAYTALVWLLIALPMMLLTASPSLGGALTLSLALAIAVAVLWRLWPAFGLIMLWDDAYPASDQGSWIATALRRSLAFAHHVSAEERFFSQFLPSALATLALSMGALVLSGLYDVIPGELRTLSLWIYGLIVLPLACLIIANRTLRALLLEPGDRHRPATQTPSGALRERPRGLAETPQLSPHDTLPGVRDQAFLQAVRDGDIARAQALLDAGADANTLPATDDANQRSALTLAALHPDTRLLRALIAHGADVNQRQHGMTALLAVTRDGCLSRAEAIMMLIANGADVSATDADGNSALHHAARSTDLSVVADLVDAGAPIDSLNRRGQTPLAAACHSANWVMAEWLVKHHARTTVEGGEPALVAAAGIADDDPAGINLLLANKARANARDNLDRSALMTAALEGHVLIARALIDARADVNAADAHGTTALMEAARTGATDIVAMLCAAGADIATRDRHGRDALMLACLSSRASAATVGELMQAGADPRGTDEDGRSALDCATSAGRWDLVAILDPSSELPANVAAQQTPDPEAATPEHLLDALRFGHWAIVGGFATLAPTWPASDLARLYLTLADAKRPRACAWLLDHGLAPDAHLADGERLFDALLAALPASADALAALLHAGASPAGAHLARVIKAAASAPQVGVPLATQLLASGADPFSPLADGRTPLHLATQPGWQPTLDALLDAGLDPNARDHDGHAPLHAALTATPASAAAVRALVAAGADPERSDANGETPLGLAMTMDDPALVRWLRWTPWTLPARRLFASDLPAAAAAGDLDAVNKLLELGFAVDSLDTRGASALVYAAGRGHREVAARLIDAGADVGFITTSGVTPLVAAINARQLALMPLLVEHGARVDQRLPGGITALMVASAQGHADAVKALAAADADINATDTHGHTALHVAAQYCFASHDSLRARRVLDALLEAGADINAVDSKGLTPLLMLLGAHEKPGADCDPTHLGALLPVLLDAGARHEHADPRGVTALHACAMHALLAPARILLTRGADRTALDAFDRRAADVARQLGYADVAVELDDRHGTIPGVRQTLRTPAQPD